MVDDRKPLGARPSGGKKKSGKEPKAELTPSQQTHREKVLKIMQEHGFPVTDEAVIDFMSLHLEAVERGEKLKTRPSKYLPEMNEYVIFLGKRGYSIKQIASMLDVSHFTLYDWAEENEEFSQSLARAREGAQNWWETIGQSALFAERFNTFIWNKIISNRFRQDYTDRKGLPYDPKAPEEIEQVDDGAVTLDLRALTREQREALAIAIEDAENKGSG